MSTTMTKTYRIPFFPCDLVSVFRRESEQAKALYLALFECGLFHSSAFPYFRSRSFPGYFFFFKIEDKDGWLHFIRTQNTPERFENKCVVYGDSLFNDCMEQLSTASDTYKNFLDRLVGLQCVSIVHLQLFLDNFLQRKEQNLPIDPGLHSYMKPDGEKSIVSLPYSGDQNGTISDNPVLTLRAVDQFRVDLYFTTSSFSQICVEEAVELCLLNTAIGQNAKEILSRIRKCPRCERYFLAATTKPEFCSPSCRVSAAQARIAAQK